MPLRNNCNDTVKINSRLGKSYVTIVGLHEFDFTIKIYTIDNKA